MISNIWNDCPICGQEMVFKELPMFGIQIKCPKLCYLVDIDDEFIEEYRILSDLINIDNYQIRRDCYNSTSIGERVGNYLEEEIYLDFVIDLDRINSVEKIKKLLILL